MEEQVNKIEQEDQSIEGLSHIFANDSEACPEFDWATDSNAVLLDIKYLMKEFYTATFTSEGTALKLTFNNGQSFIITVSNCA